MAKRPYGKINDETLKHMRQLRADGQLIIEISCDTGFAYETVRKALMGIPRGTNQPPALPGTQVG
jgi:hypothetical protein